MNVETFTGYSGRIGRQTWWIAGVIVGGLQAVVSVFWEILGRGMGRVDNPGGPSVLMLLVGIGLLVVFIALIWAGFAIHAKRWHDRGKSGWWSLIAFIPIVGALWMLVELGFLKGDEGPNRFGPPEV